MFSKFMFWLFPPRNAANALKIRERFAMAYGFFGWNAFILAFYTLYKKNMPEEFIDKKIALATKVGHNFDNMHVIRMDGMRVTQNSTESIAKLIDVKETQNIDKETLETT